MGTSKKSTKKKAVKPVRKKTPVDKKYKELMKTAKELSIPVELLQQHIYNFGRPTEYKSEMCSQLIVVMATGRTFTDACTILGISTVTGYNWIKQPTEDSPNEMFKQDFFNAYKLGQALSDLWWDEIGRKNLNNKNFNNTLYMMFRQNLHGWTRRLEGKLETQHTEKYITENKTTVEHRINISGDEQIAEIARILDESGALESAVKEFVASETH